MTLRARLTLGLLTIAVVLIVPLFIATWSLGRVHEEAHSLRDGDFAASLVVGRLRDALADLRSAELAVLYSKLETSKDSMQVRVRRVSRLADSLTSYKLLEPAREIRAAMQIVENTVPVEFSAAFGERAEEAERISNDIVAPAIARAERGLGSAERALRERTGSKVELTAAYSKRGATSAIVGLLLALGIVAVVATLLTRSISRPVYELEKGMREVADGSLDAKLTISHSRSDEFGRLAASFADMTRQLAELDKLKAEFISVASHELKTPINVILGYTQLLQEDLYGPLTEKQRNVADVLEKQARNLSRLVNQLLDITRFEAGGGKLEVRPTELRGFLHNLEEAFQVLADQRGIRFQVSAEDGLPQTVYWDSDRINEVLGNLVSNAFKFTDRGGEVDLNVALVEQSIQMEVHDTGAGIPADQVPRIFDKFFQATNQPEHRPGGSGLGLAIARQIVEAHGGTISVESTPGVGTTFTIVMPQQVAGRRSSAQNHALAEV
jgi:signal transduction histidine kinase